MRRQEREVKDQAKIKEIILSCQCCRLGFYDRGEVYIVPLNFGYQEDGEKRLFYFHGAKAGRKFKLIQKNPKVGFELDANHQLIKAETACKHSACYQSVIGTGNVRILDRPEEKANALQIIMSHNTGRENWEIPLAMLEAVCVFQLEVETLSCKERLL